MELILISDSKLKIMLSQKDMNKYDLNIEDLSYDNTETRRAFWSILDEAKHKTGFDAAREKIYVQVFPCRSGGCEIFVTKLENRDNRTELKLSDIYKFSRLDNLLSVCNILSERGYDGESSVYCDKTCYYLTLEPKKGIEFIAEYADMRENKNYIYHILEHCDRICAKGAVDILAPLR